MDGSLLMATNLENPRRPICSNAGQGGKRAQLEKVVDSIRPDLNPENARSARVYKQAFPEDARENALAPAAKAKTRRKTAAAKVRFLIKLLVSSLLIP